MLVLVNAWYNMVEIDKSSASCSKSSSYILIIVIISANIIALEDSAKIWSSFHLLGFCISCLQCKVSNPQPGGPSPCIFVLQWQGGLVIPLGTGFPFLYLLRLAGLEWRHSNLPPHGGNGILWLKVNRML
jgi:hypothetical protein